jgi:hypothetical protein
MGILTDYLDRKHDKEDSQALLYANMIKSGNLSPVPHPGKDATPEQINDWTAENSRRQQQFDYATSQLKKYYGGDKEGKGLFDKFVGVLHHIHQKHSGQPPAIESPPPGAAGPIDDRKTTSQAGMPSQGATGAAGASPRAAMAAWPPTGPNGSGSPPARFSSGDAASRPPDASAASGAAPTISSPPPAGPAAALPAAGLGSVLESANPSPEALSDRALKAKLDLTNAEFDQKVAEAEKLGLKKGTPQYLEWMSGGKIRGGAFAPKVMTRQVMGSDIQKSDPDMTTATGEPVDPSKRYDIFSDSATGARYAMPSGAVASMLGPDKAAGVTGGPPEGITVGGVFKQPGDPDWTAQNQKQFDAMTRSYKSSEAAKDRRVQVSASARAKAFASLRPVGVVRKSDGELMETTSADVAAHPELYAPAGPGMQTMNRSAVFDEIGYTTDQMNTAIDKMGNDAFSTTARAQIAGVLRAPDPASALSTFLNSEAATTLSDAQIEYITSLVSLQESAMSLRSIAGMGQGSDQLRHAITAMLPGAETPSKAYAQRQMKLFQGEVNQLKKSVPGLGDTVPRGGTVGDMKSGPPDGSKKFIYARDPNGKVHKAAEGTALPKGWKLDPNYKEPTQ